MGLHTSTGCESPHTYLHEILVVGQFEDSLAIGTRPQKGCGYAKTTVEDWLFPSSFIHFCRPHPNFPFPMAISKVLAVSSFWHQGAYLGVVLEAFWNYSESPSRYSILRVIRFEPQNLADTCQLLFESPCIFLERILKDPQNCWIQVFQPISKSCCQFRTLSALSSLFTVM